MLSCTKGGVAVPYKGFTESRKKANEKYLKEKTESLLIRVRPGEKEQIRAFAESRGKSVNAFIVGLIRAAMDKGDQ